MKNTAAILVLILSVTASFGQGAAKGKVAVAGVAAEDGHAPQPVTVTITESTNVNVVINYHSTMTQEAGENLMRDVASPGQLQAIESEVLGGKGGKAPPSSSAKPRTNRPAFAAKGRSNVRYGYERCYPSGRLYITRIDD